VGYVGIMVEVVVVDEKSKAVIPREIRERLLVRVGDERVWLGEREVRKLLNLREGE